VLLNELLPITLAKGWMLPVVPGTSYITLGGAVANDVHGKNHHAKGSFGCHVKRFELLRSTNERLVCSPQENTDYFKATIGGLGLTGLITWVELQLMPVHSAVLDTVTMQFSCLEEFFALSKKYSKDYEYTTAWLDTTSTGKDFGRGYFTVANHEKHNSIETKTHKKNSVSFYLPSWLLNKFSVSLFNKLVYATAPATAKLQQQDLYQFLFPLDNLLQWNRIYGKRGFLQYQFVIPKTQNYQQALTEILSIIVTSGQSSFLSVLKMFGHAQSPGMLSFPCEGITLALDFPFKGEQTLQLLAELDAKVLAYKGRVYPAKDARMSSMAFKRYFPNWQEFSEYKDKQFSSSFWRRVMKDGD
jgi:FAD/FMN-containing dehydrogenase